MRNWDTGQAVMDRRHFALDVSPLLTRGLGQKASGLWQKSWVEFVGCDRGGDMTNGRYRVMFGSVVVMCALFASGCGTPLTPEEVVRAHVEALNRE
ncbi:MAG: hypothetical protein AAB288_15440, partial [Acidobacteriota bacterium]